MNYNKLFCIQKELYKHSIPDDLVPIFFDYIGDLDETSIDLINKRCFWKIEYKHPTLFKNYYFRLGYYCNVCNKILQHTSVKQLKNHTKTKTHHVTLYENKKNFEADLELKLYKVWFAYLNISDKICALRKLSDRKKKQIYESFKIERVTI